MDEKTGLDLVLSEIRDNLVTATAFLEAIQRDIIQACALGDFGTYILGPQGRFYERFRRNVRGTNSEVDGDVYGCALPYLRRFITDQAAGSVVGGYEMNNRTILQRRLNLAVRHVETQTWRCIGMLGMSAWCIFSCPRSLKVRLWRLARLLRLVGW